MSEGADGDRRLFQFSVPGLPGVTLAVPAQSVISVLHAGQVHPLPLTPAAVLGLHQASDQMLAVLDLAALLGGAGQEPGPDDALQTLVVNLLFGDTITQAAWPILPGGAILQVPAHLPRAEEATTVASDLIFDVVLWESSELHLLRLDKIPDHLLSTVAHPD